MSFSFVGKKIKAERIRLVRNYSEAGDLLNVSLRLFLCSGCFNLLLSPGPGGQGDHTECWGLWFKSWSSPTTDLITSFLVAVLPGALRDRVSVRAGLPVVSSMVCQHVQLSKQILL